jgi:hypothetical protein
MSIDLRIINPSKKSYYITSDLAPVADHVAISLEEAQRAHYIAGLTPTLYPTNEKNTSQIVRLRPGGSAVVHVRYAVVARFKANPPIPGSIPPGKYVLQLDLRTENGFAAPAKDDDAKGRIVSLKTEPISFKIPPNVRNPPECKPPTKP